MLLRKAFLLTRQFFVTGFQTWYLNTSCVHPSEQFFLWLQNDCCGHVVTLNFSKICLLFRRSWLMKSFLIFDDVIKIGFWTVNYTSVTWPSLMTTSVAITRSKYWHHYTEGFRTEPMNIPTKSEHQSCTTGKAWVGGGKKPPSFAFSKQKETKLHSLKSSIFGSLPAKETIVMIYQKTEAQKQNKKEKPTACPLTHTLLWINDPLLIPSFHSFFFTTQWTWYC